VDVVVRRHSWWRKGEKLSVKKPEEVKGREKIVDIGPETIRLFALYLRKAQTMLWNGPMGQFEIASYSHGSIALGAFLASRAKGIALGIVGGGETVACLEKTKMTGFVDHVSTGGGAMLAFLAGKKLPGLEALKEKQG